MDVSSLGLYCVRDWHNGAGPRCSKLEIRLTYVLVFYVHVPNLWNRQQRKEVVQCLIPNAVTSLGPPAKLERAPDRAVFRLVQRD